MNILYLCSDPGIPVLGHKGASVHVRALVSAFTAAGHSVAIAAPLLVGAAGDAAASIDAELLHVPPSDGAIAAMHAVTRFGERLGVAATAAHELRRILYNEEVEREVLARVGRFAADCVYERGTVYGTAGVAIARRLGVPLVVELNAPLALEQSTYRGTSFPELAREAERYTLSNADVVLVVSAPLRDYVVAQGTDAGRVHVMPNGIDSQLFAPAPASQAVRDRWGTGPGPVIGFVGGLRPWHGVRALPALVERLARRHSGLRLVVAGDGPLRHDLTIAFRDRGVSDRVCFTGPIAHGEVAGIIRTFDIALAPYDASEHPFYFSPLKLFEYMGCGVAVVAASLGQIADVIRDGEDGLLYAPGDEAGLAQACERLLADSDLRARLGRRAAAVVHGRFTWRRNATAIIDLVESARARLAAV
jgi:glycosyltransferase involved in cell wall biosynthesis